MSEGSHRLRAAKYLGIDRRGPSPDWKSGASESIHSRKEGLEPVFVLEVVLELALFVIISRPFRPLLWQKVA